MPRATKELSTMSNTLQPVWLERAWRDLGVLEGDGRSNNPRVLAYYADAGHPTITSDDVAWCAAFASAVLERAGHRSTRSLLARSYLTWGDPLITPRLGTITVLSRGADSGAGHVGFYIGETADHLILLGGNQSDSVRVSAFPRDQLLGFRWPGADTSAITPTEPQAPPPSLTIFDIAFAHVLDMEGGWTDDPYDPGGPTNLGITLAVYAAFKGQPLDASTTSDLTAQLRALTPQSARAIYLKRYWAPAHCFELSSGLAVMQFDTAVNHGVGNAIRFLQQSLGVDVDGEIGPETLGAASAQPQQQTLATYADLRRARYRALPHFWRFGRGWLRRVDATLALSLAQRELPISKTTQPKETTMTATNRTNAEILPQPKWWGESLTIWGTLITALSTVLPILGPLLGLDLTPDLIKKLGADILITIQAIGGLIGTIMAILGRVRAVQPLMRRPIRISL
jgi:uncharacterized protein (TIGR02594 family)